MPFDKSLALNTLLPLCEQAYSTTPTLARDFSSCTPILTDAPEINFGFVARTPGNVYIVFRGTETGSDWFQDCVATETQCRWSDGRVHSGFMHVYDSVRRSVWLALARLVQPGDRVIVTGHSLGAALAILAASDIGPERISAVYTFAGPRCGDSAFAAAFKTPCYRIVNHWDLVPDVPTAPPFQHVGKAVVVTGPHKAAIPAHSLSESYSPGLKALSSA